MGCGVLIVVDRLPPVKRLLSWWNGCVSNNLGINSMSSKCVNRAELIGSSLGPAGSTHLGIGRFNGCRFNSYSLGRCWKSPHGLKNVCSYDVYYGYLSI